MVWLLRTALWAAAVVAAAGVASSGRSLGAPSLRAVEISGSKAPRSRQRHALRRAPEKAEDRGVGSAEGEVAEPGSDTEADAAAALAAAEEDVGQDAEMEVLKDEGQDAGDSETKVAAEPPPSLQPLPEHSAAATEATRLGRSGDGDAAAAAAVREAEDLVAQAEVQTPARAAPSPASLSMPPPLPAGKEEEEGGEEQSEAEEAAEESAEEKQVEEELKAAEALTNADDGAAQGAAEAPVGKKAEPMLDKASPAEQQARREVRALEEQITHQTKSKGLAEMLGSLKMDVYRLSAKLNMVEQEIEDGVRMEAKDPAEDLIYPVSTCMKCILMLTAQYFVLYTGLALCKAFTGLLGVRQGNLVEQSLRAACDTVFYAPMLCVLFLGAQLRALQITAGKGGPQESTELAMEVCAWSVLAQTLLALAVPVLTGRAAGVDEDSGLILPQMEQRALAGILALVRYTAMAGLYAGLAVVCVQVILMDARNLGTEPPDMWDDPTTAATEYAPPVSAAMACTMGLTVLFFLVYLSHSALRSCLELSGGSLPEAAREGHDSGMRVYLEGWEQCLRTCTQAVNLAPVICALFMAVRMRALEIDAKVGRPQPWAETCFYICVGSIMADVLSALVAEAFGASPAPGGAAAAALPVAPAPGLQAAARTRPAEAGDTVVDFAAPTSARPAEKLALAARGAAMSLTYISVLGVVVSAWVIQAPPGRPTPAVAPALQCVMFLTAMYLGVYLCIFFTQVAAMAAASIGALAPARGQAVTHVVHALRMAEHSVKLSPMLAVLFIGVRMRALQLSKQRGAPQCWAQDAMYGVTVALLVQLVAVLAVAALAPDAGVDESGSPVPKSVSYFPGRLLLYVLQVATFLALHGGTAAVVISALAIRPETAVCHPDLSSGVAPLASLLVSWARLRL